MASRGSPAEAGPWALDLSGDRAGVSLGDFRTAWWTGRAQLSYRREGKGGALVAVQPLRRSGAADTTLIAAGWRHAGPWSVYAEVGGTPSADFHYRRAGELEVFRRLTGPWVGHASYRYLAYSAQTVHVSSARITREGPRSELHARLILARNATQDTNSEAVVVRGRFDVNARLRVGGGVAIGERIFDVTGVPLDPAQGWVAFGDARVAIGDGNYVGVDARVAEEGPTFRQVAFGLSYRRSF